MLLTKLSDHAANCTANNRRNSSNSIEAMDRLRPAETVAETVDKLALITSPDARTPTRLTGGMQQQIRTTVRSPFFCLS